jgi:catechol 2,3-dioxygenase-like lactoylglutathione lyase family enzyme
MEAQLNHTIVWCREKVRSAQFLAAILDRPPPTEYGPFRVVEMDNGVSLDFHDTAGPIAPQHYAFLIKDEAFDEIIGRIKARGLTYWADPGKSRANEINHGDGGRGCYFEDPDGHLLEVLTRPYGSGS